jgi:hypothetical protein
MLYSVSLAAPLNHVGPHAAGSPGTLPMTLAFQKLITSAPQKFLAKHLINFQHSV